MIGLRSEKLEGKTPGRFAKSAIVKSLTNSISAVRFAEWESKRCSRKSRTVSCLNGLVDYTEAPHPVPRVPFHGKECEPQGVLETLISSIMEREESRDMNVWTRTNVNRLDRPLHCEIVLPFSENAF